MDEPERFVLTLEALPGFGPVIQRLRRALKALRRAYGFQCTRIVEDRQANEDKEKGDDARWD